MNTAILRLPAARGPYSRSAFYERMDRGLMTRPVRIGLRAVGWPSYEVDAISRAVIAGRSDDEIRALVRRLEAERALADQPRPAAHLRVPEPIVSGGARGRS